MTFDKWIPRHFSIIPQSGSQFCLTYHCVILRPSLILPNHILISHLIASVLHDAKRTPNHEIVHYDIDMLVETWSWAVAMCQQNPKAHWLGVSQTRLGCFVVSPLCRGKGHLAFHFWVLPFCFMVFPCNGKSIGKEERVALQVIQKMFATKFCLWHWRYQSERKSFCSGRTRCSASVLHRASSNLVGCVQCSTLFASLFDTVHQL